MNPGARIKTLFSVVPTLCVSVGFIGSVAHAEEVWLEEIIVTAQKRYETTQEVPIAISAFTEDTLKNINAQNITDLGRFTPGLEARNPSATQPDFSIRGITTDDFGIGSEPSVAIYMDGVYVGRSGSAQLNFNDIERVEILRGPQGTLFGRNAAAGAISVITKKPTALTEGNVQVSVGNYNKLKLEGIFNTELADGVYGRFGALWNQRDGFIDNNDPSGQGEDELGQEGNWSLTAGILWDFDDTEVVWRSDYDRIDKDAPYSYSINPNLYHDQANAGDPYGDYENDSPSFEERDLFGTSLTVSHDFDDDLSFISVTAYRTFDSENRQDEDGTAIIGRFLDTHNIESNDSFSQEFRLSYHSDSDWSWSTGLSYFREEAEQEHRVIFGTEMADLLLAAGLDENNIEGVIPDDQWNGGDGVSVISLDAIEFVNTYAGLLYDGIGISGTPTSDELLALGIHTDQMFNELTFSSLAWYGDVTYSFTDALDLTLGLRYTRDKKDFKRETPVNREGFAYRFAFDSYENANGLAFLDQVGTALDEGDLSLLPGAPGLSYSDNPDDTWSKWTPRMVLNYRWTSDVLTYLSAARGFKAGGFNGVGFSEESIEPEIVDNLEIGFKSTWLDNRLKVNVAVFTFEYNDLQILEFVKLPDESLPSYKLTNGDAKASGVETEIFWMAMDGLMLSFNSSYLDTEYVEYMKPTANGIVDLEGEPMSSVPRESYNLGAEYTLALADLGEFVFRFDTSYVGSRVDSSGENAVTLGSYALTNARITYAHISGDWETSLWAENLFDEEYQFGGITSEGGLASAEGNSPIVRRATPRFFGLEGRYYF